MLHAAVHLALAEDKENGQSPTTFNFLIARISGTHLRPLNICRMHLPAYAIHEGNLGSKGSFITGTDVNNPVLTLRGFKHAPRDAISGDEWARVVSLAYKWRVAWS